MPGIDAVLERIRQIHQTKSSDYVGKSTDIFLNFKLAALMADISVEQAFMFLVALKLARQRSLLQKGKEACYESYEDTVIDKATYAVIEAAYLERSAGGKLVVMEKNELEELQRLLTSVKDACSVSGSL